VRVCSAVYPDLLGTLPPCTGCDVVTPLEERQQLLPNWAMGGGVRPLATSISSPNSCAICQMTPELSSGEPPLAVYRTGGTIMNDKQLVGPGSDAFLLEHLVAECNFSSNTQSHYRDP